MLDALKKLLIGLAEKFDRFTRSVDIALNRSDTDGPWRSLVAPRQSPGIVLTGFVAVLALINGPMPLQWRGASALVLAIVATALAVALMRVHTRLERPLIRDGLPSMRGWKAWVLLAPWLLLAVPALASDTEWASSFGFTLLALGVVTGAIGAAAVPRGLLPLLVWLVLAAAATIAWLLLASPTARAADAGVVYRSMIAPAAMLPLFFALPFARWWAWFLFRDHREDYRRAFRSHLVATPLFATDESPPARGTDIVRAYVLAITATPAQLLLAPAFAVLLAPRALLWPVAITVAVVWWMFMAMVVFQPRLDSLRGVLDRLFMEGASLLLSLVAIAFAAGRVLDIGYVTTVLDGSTAATLTQYLLVLYSMSWMIDYAQSRALTYVLLGLLDDDIAPARIALPATPEVPDAENWLQPHGGARLLARQATPQGERLEIVPPLRLFETIADHSPAGSLARRRLGQLQTQVRFYRLLPTLFVIAASWWFGAQVMALPRQAHIAAMATTAPADRAFSLRELHGKAAGGVHDDVYVVAASGGGTRAALWTKTVLQALATRGDLDRVVLVSSVSGGSLATAFFAAHRGRLVAGDADAWAAFHTAVTASHIAHVLSGAFEWRLLTGRRLGTLLAESFDPFLRSGHTTLGDCKDLGLVLNTTIAGSQLEDDRALSTEAGGRLLFTNVAEFDAAAIAHGENGYAPDLALRVVGDPRVDLGAAAAASADFPPVFSLLPIDDVDAAGRRQRRYWVTDGGALDNRGLIEAQLVVRAALQKWTNPPRVHFLVVDASAYGDKFTQDRGIGAAASAARQLADRLIAELFADLRRLHPLGDNGVQVHDLTLPAALRKSGSFGTHWMMPTFVRIESPRGDSDAHDDLDRYQLERLFVALLSRPARTNWSDNLKKWIAIDDPLRVFDALPATGR